MGYMTSDEFKAIAGEVLTSIDISADDQDTHKIMLTTESGRQILIHHAQDCCESVAIESVDGDPSRLIGKVLLTVNVVEEYKGEPVPEYPKSWTRTTLEFGVTDETVVVKWIGESNGYYSESVDFKELANAKRVGG